MGTGRTRLLFAHRTDKISLGAAIACECNAILVRDGVGVASHLEHV